MPNVFKVLSRGGIITDRLSILSSRNFYFRIQILIIPIENLRDHSYVPQSLFPGKIRKLSRKLKALTGRRNKRLAKEQH